MHRANARGGMQAKSNASAFKLADLLTIGIIVVAGVAIFEYVGAGNMPLAQEVKLSNSISDIPKYTLLSFTRSILALLWSFLFSLAYATLAAKRRRAERILLPMLDVLQSLPVLTFLAPAVLTLIAVFRHSRWGLEIACIFLIFTGQAWNLALGYYESQKSVSKEFSEVSRLVKLTRLQEFFYIDLPNGVRPLVYNGMLSMAGGWFFLATYEAFTLGEKSFLLPGLGSYLSSTFQNENYTAFTCGIITMIAMILGVDIVLWRPLIAWSARFRDINDTSPAESSYFLEVFRKTHIPAWISQVVRNFLSRVRAAPISLPNRHNYEALLRAGAEIQNFMHLRETIKSRHVRRVSRSLSLLPWMRWFVSFSLAMFIIYVLPLAPRIGTSLAVLSSEDWLEITNSLFLSGIKVVAATLIGCLWTLPVGLMIGQNQKLARYAVPISQNIAAFPAPLFFPLIAMIAARGHISGNITAVFLMLIGTQWYTLFNIISGAKTIPEDLKVVSQLYRMNFFSRWRYLYMPAMLPSFGTGVRAAAGGAWNITIVAEMVKFPGGQMVSTGIGAEISQASEMGDYPRLVAAIVVLTVGVVLINRLVWRPLTNYTEALQA